MIDKFYNRKRMAYQLYIFTDSSIELISKNVGLTIKEVEEYIDEKEKETLI